MLCLYWIQNALLLRVSYARLMTWLEKSTFLAKPNFSDLRSIMWQAGSASNNNIESREREREREQIRIWNFNFQDGWSVKRWSRHYVTHTHKHTHTNTYTNTHTHRNEFPPLFIRPEGWKSNSSARGNISYSRSSTAAAHNGQFSIKTRNN